MGSAAQKIEPWNTDEFNDKAASFARDPWGFVLWAWDWGVGELKGAYPEDWQRDCLMRIGKQLRAKPLCSSTEVWHLAYREAIASGHGIGKSALIAWVVMWALSTMPDTVGVITANTEKQLSTKTMARLAQWHRSCITAPWFKCTATAIYSAEEAHQRTWRFDAIPWSEFNAEAFAGLHNQGKRIVVLYDEASAIARTIWETTEGALTDTNTEILWLAFGNPTQQTGPFRECFGLMAHRWHTKQIDSRTVSITNKEQINQWIEDYGEDSDFVRVRVKGQFPKQSSRSVIGSEAVRLAQTRRELPTTLNMPVIVGVDVARFGEDRTVFACRKGRDARSHKWRTYRGLPTDQVAARLIEYAKEVKADCINIDGGAMGAGVVDYMRSWGYEVNEIHFGGKAFDPTIYLQKRDEMWFSIREWLDLDGVLLPVGAELESDLTGPEYHYDKLQRIVVESKEDMRRRGVSSPDMGDALALTFAVKVAPKRDEFKGPLKTNSKYKVM